MDDWRKYLDKVSLIDDAFTKLVFKYKPELFIKILKTTLKETLNLTDIEINPESIKIQDRLPELYNKEVILDVSGKSIENDFFGMEFQADPSDFPKKRGDYYSSSMESSLLKKGQEYNELPDHYLIVFCKGDITGKGRAISRLQKGDRFTGDWFEGSYEIYINLLDPNLKEFEDIYRIGQDILERNPDKIMDDEIRESIKYFKESEEGMSQLESPFEEYAQEVNKTVINENRTLNDKLNAVNEKLSNLSVENNTLNEKLNTVVNENDTLNEKLNTVVNENKALIQENTQLKESLKDQTVRLDKLEKIINEL